MKHLEELAELKRINLWKMAERDRKELFLKSLRYLRPEIFEDMRNTLKYYDEVYLTYENGRFEVSVGLTIKAKYAKDYIFYGAFDKSFFDYSEEELQIAREELSQCQWF